MPTGPMLRHWVSPTSRAKVKSTAVELSGGIADADRFVSDGDAPTSHAKIALAVVSRTDPTFPNVRGSPGAESDRADPTAAPTSRAKNGQVARS